TQGLFKKRRDRSADSLVRANLKWSQERADTAVRAPILNPPCGSRCAGEDARAPGAGITSVGGYACLLAKLVETQIALGESAHIGLLHTNRHDCAARGNSIVMFQQFPPCCCLPEPNGIVRACRDNPTAIRAEFRTPDSRLQ